MTNDNDVVVDMKPHLGVVGDGYKVTSDAVLDGFKGGDFPVLMVAAFDPEGKVVVALSGGDGDGLLLLERAKHLIVFGVDGWAGA